jgi:large subunit ribosomal protein L30
MAKIKTKTRGVSRMVKITLVKSPIGFDKTQATTVQGMGLRRIGHTVELVDTPATRGMILKVRHLVTVQENS